MDILFDRERLVQIIFIASLAHHHHVGAVPKGGRKVLVLKGLGRTVHHHHGRLRHPLSSIHKTISPIEHFGDDNLERPLERPQKLGYATYENREGLFSFLLHGKSEWAMARKKVVFPVLIMLFLTSFFGTRKGMPPRDLRKKLSKGLPE